MPVSIDHPIAKKFENDEKIPKKFKLECAKTGTTEEALAVAEKIGFATNLFVLHPFQERNTKLPIYIANFVLMDYGTGAIFGCPAHDQRDLDFARQVQSRCLACCKTARIKFTRQNLPLINEAYTGDGILFNSDFLNDLSVEDAIKKSIQKLLN